MNKSHIYIYLVYGRQHIYYSLACVFLCACTYVFKRKHIFYIKLPMYVLIKKQIHVYIIMYISYINARAYFYSFIHLCTFPCFDVFTERVWNVLRNHVNSLADVQIYL